MIFLALFFAVFFNIWVQFFYEESPKFIKNRLLKALFIFPAYKVTYRGLITYVVHLILLIVVAIFYLTNLIYIEWVKIIVGVTYIIISGITCYWSQVFKYLA